ncbi:DNA primase, partial [Candidatus Microgenomates bacterium]|nr:DNA primase [Candidatus Microgenomates bacterium]
RAGRNWKALCPFHKERTPSFIVSPELQIWRCFGACAEGGDIFKFVMKMENIEFGEAVRLLAKRAGVTLTPRFGPQPTEKDHIYRVNATTSHFYNYLLTQHPIGNNARSYLKRDRGLTDATIARFELGFAPPKDALTTFIVKKRGFPVDSLMQSGLIVKTERGITDRFRGRIIFPLRDHRGNTLGFSGRILPQDEKRDLAKYVNTPETPAYHKRQHVFGLDITHEAIKEEGYAVIVEGEFDLLSLWQAGVTNSVAIKGTAFTEEQARLLSRFCQEIVFALDSDQAGQQATQQGIMMALQYFPSVRVATLGAFKDPDEAVRSDREGFKKALRTALNAYDFFIESAFSRYPSATTADVAVISRDLVPIIAAITDKIVQAHYIKVIADKLEIAEDAVVSQIVSVAKKNEKTVVMAQRDGENSSSKTRRERLEERLVSVALQKDPPFLLSQETDGLITSPVLLRIREELGAFLKKSKKFDSMSFVKHLPSELVDTATALLISPLNFEGERVDTTPDIPKTRQEINILVKDIKTLALSDRIEQLTRTIKEKEQKGADSRREQEELTRLIANLSQVKF